MILATLDAWSTSHLSYRPSKPAYYIADWRILSSSAKLLTWEPRNIFGHTVEWPRGQQCSQFGGTKVSKQQGASKSCLSLPHIDEIFLYVLNSDAIMNSNKIMWKIFLLVSISYCEKMFPFHNNPWKNWITN